MINSENNIKTLDLTNLNNAIIYLEDFIKQSLKAHLSQSLINEYPVFEFVEGDDSFYKFCMECQLTFEEFIIILLALMPHVKPNLLDHCIEDVLDSNTNLPEIGGKKTKDIRYMMPTADTAIFILGGYDLNNRISIQNNFSTESFLITKKIIHLEEVKYGEPQMSGRLVLDQEYVDLFTKGYINIPKFCSSFPAQYITTDLEFSDLVVSNEILDQIKEIKNWVKHSETFYKEWNVKNKFKRGYLALLHGPPGTGKTLTSTLLGKYTGRPVFRVDLSTVVSKYIGETEKNLANLFDKAENKNWILAFEEADALFTKRTAIKSSNDKHSNQEVSYLLQRIESFSGLVILTSNFKGNMDEAFLRRFNSIIHYPFPTEDERHQIWKKSFPNQVHFETNTNITKLASKYELAGGNIINVVQYACLKAIERGNKTVNEVDVEIGIKREFEKNGKVFQKIQFTEPILAN